mgnify:CR=1 FL=1
MEPTQQPGNKLVPVLVILLVIASFLIGSLYTKSNLLEKGAVAGANNGNVAGANTGGNAVPPANPAPAETTPVDVDVSGVEFLGSPNAKVAVVEFTDYQCPFCGQLFKNAYPQIKKDYIDSGKIKYMVKDFPLFQIHPYAQKAAEAASCARDQKKFWEMHDTLFNNQTALTTDDLKKYAGNLSLNTGTFNDCLDSGKYADAVKKSATDGEALGVRGTPASFIGKISGNTVNGVQISGAVPFETFKAAIDKALKG